MNIFRLLKPPQRSFFLFGPRGVGKSTWLSEKLPMAKQIDLLESQTYLELSRSPGLLGSRLGQTEKNDWVIIDEIQKIPMLLDEVHRLIEKRGLRFALSGSSARKLKKQGTNLLGGRAVTRNLAPFSYQELGRIFDLDFALSYGALPLVTNNKNEAADLLTSYMHTYVKEEIREEGLVRKIEPFIRFLEIAGLMHGKQLSIENVSRDCFAPRTTVEVYFAILEDTLLGLRLPSYRPKAKVREQVHPKFFWFDNGVARAAAGLIHDPPDSEWMGNALESLILHELTVYNQTFERHRDIYFYRTHAGLEIDFVIETQKAGTNRPARVVCLEVKNSKKWRRDFDKPMRLFKESGRIKVDTMYGIYRGDERLDFDGVMVLPVKDFLERLFKGEVF